MNRILTILALSALLLAGAPAPGQAASPQTLVVGADGDYATIQAAVDAAQPGDTVFILSGVYQEAVLVTTRDITIRGEDRLDVVLDGGGFLDQAITVVADGVTVESLTATNYASNGIVFSGVDGFVMRDLYAKDNHAYGLYAIRSTNGRITENFAEGHGDSGFYIGETPACNCDVDHNRAWNNMLGYSGTANSHLRIWNNEFHNNRGGILMSVLPNEIGVEDDLTIYGTQVRTKIYGNYIHDNNDHTRTVGIFETIKPPVGEGITIAGGWMNEVYDNTLVNNRLWGIGLFWLTTPPRGNWIHDNVIDGSRYGIWWDEMGEDNCFENNAAGNVTVYSDPSPLPGCQNVLGADIPCPPMLHDFAACRASDVRAPSAVKLAGLAMRSYFDMEPEEDPLPVG